MNSSSSSIRRGSGRPKSEEKRDAIRLAAGQLFLRQGLQRSTMDAIAAEAGVSKQTVYSHFRCKEELFEAVIAGKVEEYFLEAADFLPVTDVRQTLEDLGRRFVDLIYDAEAIAMWRVVIAESTAHPEIAAAFFEQGPRKTFSVLRRVLRACAEAGQLAIADPEEGAALFITMARGLPHMEVLCGLSPPPTAAWRELHVAATAERFLSLCRPSR
jgi:TetR/AcrR family transcriptional repressor of mexJK operon